MHLFQFSMPIQTLWYVFFSWTRAAFYGMLCFVTGFSSVRLSHLKRTLSTWHFCSCSEAFLRQLLQPWIRWSETPFRKFGDFGVSLCRTWGLILSTGAIFFDILNQQTSNKIQTQSDRGGRIWALRCAFGIQSCIWELLDWSLLINVVWIWSPTWQNECDIQILQQEEETRHVSTFSGSGCQLQSSERGPWMLRKYAETFESFMTHLQAFISPQDSPWGVQTTSNDLKL